jgi:hypothetical protein
VLRDYQAGLKEENVIFMVNNYEECVELQRLLGAEKAMRVGQSKEKYTLLVV